MKFLKYALLFVASTLILSCSSDNEQNDRLQHINETDGLVLVKIIENQTHKIAIYTKDSKLTDGYNKVYLQLKDQDGELISNANISWKPMMYMANMQHSSPHSEVKKAQGKQSLYEGWLVFQMADNQSDHWKLNFEYNIAGSSYEMSGNIEVLPSSKRRVVSFSGSDNTKYVIALIEPSQPKASINDMIACVFKMASMDEFPVVDNYKVRIDPRMPSMGNHGSPNNQDLTQQVDSFYHGKLSLTMTGYWIINLMLENQSGEILKGEPVTTNNPQSSIFFELEF